MIIIAGIRKPGAKSTFLSNDETLTYLQEINAPHTYKCRVCGGLITFSDNQFYLCESSHEMKDYPYGKLRASSKKCFLGYKIYNAHEYHLSVCEDCAKKQYPGDKLSFTGHASLVCKWLYNVSDEDYKAHTQKVCVRTVESFVQKYGQEEGLKRWKHYCDLQAETNTFEYKSKKYGMTETEFREYNLSRAVTLENLIQRHGEIEGKRIFEEYCEKQRYTTSLEYFVETYGEKEGKEKYDNFVKLRGEQGIKNFKERNGVSKIADEFCQLLAKRFEGNKIYTNSLNHEWNLNYQYFLDYYDKTLNIVVEFYGDFWHYNPQMFEDASLRGHELFRTSDYINRSDVWEHDRIRQEYIIQKLGLKPENFIIVWENDYRKDKLGTITKVENIIRGKIPNDTLPLCELSRKYEQLELF